MNKSEEKRGKLKNKVFAIETNLSFLRSRNHLWNLSDDEFDAFVDIGKSIDQMKELLAED